MTQHPSFLPLFIILFLFMTTTTTSSSTTPPAGGGATIPAFPEQTDLAACPLNLPPQLFHDIKSSCSGGGATAHNWNLRRSRCCPVLATWLYSAYSETALGRAGRVIQTTSYEMPLLPDDSETCVDGLDKALRRKGVELVGPNETCDPVYCYCGIRLHPLSCPEAFGLSRKGRIVGGESVKRLERDCLSYGDGHGFPGLGGCSKCLKSLYQLNEDKMENSTVENSTKKEDRTSLMHNKDCELMGLTWLLSKNRTAYFHTVSAVLRALMMSTDGSDPLSCTLDSDGMPLAVDSSQINGSQTSSRSFSFLCIMLPCIMVYMRLSLSWL